MPESFGRGVKSPSDDATREKLMDRCRNKRLDMLATLATPVFSWNLM